MKLFVLFIKNKQKNYSSAIPLLEKIIKNSPLSSYGKESYILLGNIYSSEGKFKEAVIEYGESGY